MSFRVSGVQGSGFKNIQGSGIGVQGLGYGESSQFRLHRELRCFEKACSSSHSQSR